MTNKIYRPLRLLMACSAAFMVAHPSYVAAQASADLYAQCEAEILNHPKTYCGGKDPGVYERCVADTITRCMRYPDKYLSRKP